MRKWVKIFATLDEKLPMEGCISPWSCATAGFSPFFPFQQKNLLQPFVPNLAASAQSFHQATRNSQIAVHTHVVLVCTAGMIEQCNPVQIR